MHRSYSRIHRILVLTQLNPILHLTTHATDLYENPALAELDNYSEFQY